MSSNSSLSFGPQQHQPNLQQSSNLANQLIQDQQLNANSINTYLHPVNQPQLLIQHQSNLGSSVTANSNLMIANHQININSVPQAQLGAISATSNIVHSVQSSSSIKSFSNMNQSSNNQMSTIHSVNPIPNTSNASANLANASNSNSAPHQMQVATCNQSPNPFQELLSLFECPVCFEFALPPILQCQSGHIVCSNCRPKLSCCPTCRSALGNIRNLSMEKIAHSLKFPCKYTSYGCSESMSHENKLEHEDVCEFRMYNCPCPGASCKWQGTLDQVMPHLIQHHKSITTLQGEDIVFLATDITLPGAVDWVMMQSCFGYNFMLVLEKQEKHENYPQFFAVVQLIGTRRQAERFVYKLELNGQRRRLTWEATPRSIHEGVQQAIASSDCLVFDTQTAQLFADSGNLGINVTISLN